MLALRHNRSSHSRPGAILLVVLAMLALFAVIALSFVLYAESEATSMRNGRAARNGEADPNPQEAANDFLGQLTFGTNDNTSAMFGHDLAGAKFGWIPAGANYSPYAGNGLPSEDVSGALGLPPGSLNRTGVVNHTRSAAGQFVDPNILTVGVTPFNRSTPYTYADRANFYLAMQNPLTGEIAQPSFHRSDLFGSLNQTTNVADPGYNPNWTNATGRYLAVTPRRAEHPNFPLIPANADGSFTGHVQNMKFTTGATQHNDSLWMYAGSPVKTWRNKRYAAMVAPLILDLNGRVNMSVAGNNRNGGFSASNQGFGAWEVNPAQLGISPAELQAIVAARYGNFAPNAPPNRYNLLQSASINRGAVPPQYSRIDPDMLGSGAADPMSAALAGNYNPFLVFSPRFAVDQPSYTAEMANHPSTFNPLHWPRGSQPSAHAQGMDDLVKLASHYIDPKNRSAGTELGLNAPASFSGNTPTAQQIRALTTGFNATQSWAEVRIATAGGFANLGPVDLNRPLGDYRTNTALAYSPSNIDALTPSVNYATARAARQRLAMDIFLRLAALVPGLVDGANVTYNPLTHLLNNPLDPMVPAQTAQFNALQRLAQYAANIVDAIDSDDIKTAFVWNPVLPAADPGDAVNFPLNSTTAIELGKRVVYGTELNRLVISEAYCKLDNARTESSDSVPAQQPPLVLPMMTRPAQVDLQKKYWIELHNPLPVEPATSLVSELGGARLQYVNGVSPGATATYAVYQVEVAETTALQPLANHLNATPSNVTGDPSLVGLTLVQKLRVNNYTYDATAPAPAAILLNDERNVVRPTTGNPIAAGSNLGYYVLGPRDAHPSANVTSSMCLAESLMVVAPNLPNAMIYTTGTRVPAPEVAKSTTVILQRLANPYLPPQTSLVAPNYNPYITVDFLENIPTRDRAEFDGTDRRPGFVKSTEPSVGRRHAYANMPAFDAAMPDLATNGVVRQTLPAGNTTSPAHSFFSTNYTAGVINPGGQDAFVHFDRELINSTELMHVSVHAPHSLTQTFSNGTGANGYNLHNRATPASLAALLNDPNYPSVGTGTQMFRAFELLTTANRMPGIPLGGREPGRVNVNTIGLPGTDPRMLQTVLDPATPQLGNNFDTNLGVNAWAAMMQSRTQAWPAYRVTADESGVATDDRPFKLASGAANYTDTIFRGPNALPTYPSLFNANPITNPANAAAANSLYLQAEPHRKAWNNLTTVSDGFLVIWTVGFFEVDSPVGAPVLQFGKELFDKVPGDLRAQYSAVVDRSMLQVPTTAVAGTNGAKPWETKLMADAPISSTTITVEGIVNGTNLRIYNEGVAIDVVPGATFLRLGHSDASVGGDGEWVTFSAAAVSAPGQVNLTISATTRFHGGSTRVSNTLPGNPGPQPLFDASNPANRHIVPYFTRMEP